MVKTIWMEDSQTFTMGHDPNRVKKWTEDYEIQIGPVGPWLADLSSGLVLFRLGQFHCSIVLQLLAILSNWRQPSQTEDLGNNAVSTENTCLSKVVQGWFFKTYMNPLSSAENTILEPPNLKVFPHIPLQGLCLQHPRDCLCFTKNLAIALT